MFARFVRFMSWPDRAYLNKPVAEKQLGYEGKAYCGNCMFLREVPYRCTHHSNRIAMPNADSWLSEDSGYSYSQHPKQKNKKNKCPHYKSKKSRE